MSNLKKQIAGGFLSVKWVQNPALAEPYIKHAAEVGYKAWMCVVRHMNLNIFDESVKKAVAQVVKIVHKYDMKFILDTDPTHWAETMTARDLDSALWVIIPQKIEVENGCFEIFTPEPKGSRQADIVEISGAYELVNGSFRNILPELKIEWQHAMIGGSGFQLQGRLPNDFNGTIKLYITASDISKIDHGSELLLNMQREILNEYSDIPIDGVAWDEPGKGHGSLTSFRSGKDYLTRFKRTNGYDLKDKLIYLDEFDETPEAIKLRCDYYRTLSDMHYHVQFEHNKLAKELWGDDIILGTHQTWSGLPTDLAAGVFDHFRLGEVLSEAWTDGGFDLERKTALFPLMLADSIKKGLGKPNAYYNDWCYRPDPGKYRLMNRLKTLYNINTFTHIYSDFSEGLVNMRTEPMKNCVESDVEMLDSLNKLLGDKQGESQFAVWYGWEGYASLPKKFARTLYTFFQNTSLLLTNASLFADYVSTELLNSAEVRNGLLCTRGGSYRGLLLPYARVLPDGLWEKLLEWNEQGIKIMFIGPEPLMTNNGKEIDFVGTTGFKSYGLNAYDKFMSGIEPDAYEPAFIDATPEVQVIGEQGIEQICDRFDRLTALKTKSGIYWMPGLDPREDMLDILNSWYSNSIKVYGKCISRIFKKDGEDDFVIILAPLQGSPGWGITPSCKEKHGETRPQIKLPSFDGIIEVSGKIFKFSNCEWAALKFREGKLIDQMVEGYNFQFNT
ncbi:MAG: hypothetical protein L3J71_03895 [Victivallaceae bacterium]|nr:hypothetical protein [Victivallaceae bacterium]